MPAVSLQQELVDSCLELTEDYVMWTYCPKGVLCHRKVLSQVPNQNTHFGAVETAQQVKASIAGPGDLCVILGPA